MIIFVYYLLAIGVLFGLQNIYFKLADKFDIIDEPNHRSSHNSIVIRGGGIVFYLAMVLYWVGNDFAYPFFFIGLTIVSLVSLIDDIRSLRSYLRILAQILAVSLLLFELQLWNSSWWLLTMVFILSIGTVNAYNFMDGINGITGIYSIVVLISLFTINTGSNFIDQQLIYFVLLSLLVFGFYNFRSKAKCFAGDVGSIAMAFVIVFLVIKVILATNNWTFILFLSVYGVDSVLTISHRLLKKENIFKAHRSHLYQRLVNVKKIPHLTVALAYGALQLLINAFIIYNYHSNYFSYLQVTGLTLAPLTISYIMLKLFYVPFESTMRI